MPPKKKKKKKENGVLFSLFDNSLLKLLQSHPWTFIIHNSNVPYVSKQSKFLYIHSTTAEDVKVDRM